MLLIFGAILKLSIKPFFIEFIGFKDEHCQNLSRNIYDFLENLYFFNNSFIVLMKR
jgi:hypothetical protein